MANIWSFGQPKDSVETYANGDQVPHRGWQVFLNGVVIGELELHCHKRYGADGKLDVSYGVTAVVYSPPAGGN